jgi:hypothetical protein
MMMLKRLLVTALAAGFIAAGEAPVAVAQQPHALSTAIGRAQFQSELRDQVARVTGLSHKEIEVHATNVSIRIVLVNTGYNGDRPSDREYLASTISALVRANAEKDSAYKDIVALHVEFVKRGHWRSKIVDSVEYRRGSDGRFAHHRT